MSIVTRISKAAGIAALSAVIVIGVSCLYLAVIATGYTSNNYHGRKQ